MTGANASGNPFGTCAHSTCAPCDVQGTLHCHITLKDRILFTGRLIPVLLIAGIALYLVSPWLLAAWLLFTVIDMVFVELWALCTHCPHYGRPGRFLKCVPFKPFYKFWKPKLGPMTLLQKALFIGGFTIIFVGPFVPMLLFGQWLMLALYTPAFVAFILIVQIFFCPRCVNLACPLNRAKQPDRERFFDANPAIKKAWEEADQ